jgi:predicted N-acetyltransferase YhbS
MEIRYEIIRASDVPSATTALINDWFLIEFAISLDKLAPISWHVLAWSGESLVCHVGIVEQAATIGGESVQLGGISGVITEPAWRGRGLASEAMRRAGDHMRQATAADFGLLVCLRDRVTFYEGVGWQQTAAPMFFTDWRGEYVQTDLAIMVLPLRDRPWVDGRIELSGRAW